MKLSTDVKQLSIWLSIFFPTMCTATDVTKSRTTYFLATLTGTSDPKWNKQASDYKNLTKADDNMCRAVRNCQQNSEHVRQFGVHVFFNCKHKPTAVMIIMLYKTIYECYNKFYHLHDNKHLAVKTVGL
jgi:hypothetical protein